MWPPDRSIRGAGALGGEPVFLVSSELLKRQIISVAGGFSSGKSAFINSLLHQNVKIQLPEGVLPTTAIPMYILQTNV